MQSYRLEEFNKPFVATESSTPVPCGKEVVVDVSACGLCHSDVHLYEGFFDLGDDAKVDATRIVDPPRTLGHEIVGTVSAIGPDVNNARIGDKRVIFPWIGCGQCGICERGDQHLCNRPAALGLHRDGGFATQVLVPDEEYLIDFGPLPEAQACTYACSGLTAYSALKKVMPFPKEGSLLIIGAGGVGLSAIRLAKSLDLPAPLVAEIDQTKWELAKEAGAADVIDPTAAGVIRDVIKLTRGGVQGALDFVGSGSSFDLGFNTLGKAGTLVSVGLLGGATKISPAMISMKAVNLRGSYVGSLEEMRELMEIARSGNLPDLPVSTKPMTEVNEALQSLRNGQVRGRIVMLP